MGSPPTAAVEKPEPAAPAAPTGPVEVPIDRIVPNPHQPRHEFATDALQELANSIREHGIIQPLVVRQVPAEGRAGRDSAPATRSSPGSAAGEPRNAPG